MMASKQNRQLTKYIKILLIHVLVLLLLCDIILLGYNMCLLVPNIQYIAFLPNTNTLDLMAHQQQQHQQPRAKQ